MESSTERAKSKGLRPVEVQWLRATNKLQVKLRTIILNFYDKATMYINNIYIAWFFEEFFFYFCIMENLKEKLSKIAPYFNERQRCIVYSAEAEQIGRDGKSLVSKFTGMSRPTLNEGFMVNGII